MLITSSSASVSFSTYLNIKDEDYYVIESSMVIMSIEELKLEEVVFGEEFGYSSIRQAREDFRRLVLTKM